MGAATVAVLVVVLVLVGVVGYLIVRARQPAPPPNANEGGTDSAWDSDGAIPRDSDDMPLARPSDDPRDQSVEDLQDRARSGDPRDRPDRP